MKLPRTTPTQPTLTDEFRPYVAPPAQVQQIRRARLLKQVRLSPEEERMRRRREHEAIEVGRTQEFKRLVAGGMSRVEAGRKVYG